MRRIITATAFLIALATSAVAQSQLPANSVWGNPTGSQALPKAIAVPSCSGASSALTWTAATGFTCNSVISPTGAAGGDLSGNYPNPAVVNAHIPGTSTGTISFGSANTGATNYTATFPANTGGIAETNIANIWSLAPCCQVDFKVQTQSPFDSSNQTADTAYVQNAIRSTMATVPLAGMTGGTYSFASVGTQGTANMTASAGAVTVLSGFASGTGWKVGDLFTIGGCSGNGDAVIRVLSLSGSTPATYEILYGGTGYLSGPSCAFLAPSALSSFSLTLTGTLTSNATIIFPGGTYLANSDQFIINNNTTGAFTTTAKISNGSDTAIGTGVVVSQGTANSAATFIQTDGVNDVWLASPKATALTSAAFANPSATIGTTANNGSATTAMRSDATPALSAGVPTNNLNTQTANYSVATTDCGKTIQAGTGSTGFFTVTLPAVTSFAAGCDVIVTDGDTARGKALSGFPSDLRTKLYPKQTVEVACLGCGGGSGAWVTIRNPGRWATPSAGLTVNVNITTGVNTNDCLSTAAPCLTFAQAMADVANNFDVQGGITIQMNCTSAPCTLTNTPFLAQNYVSGETFASPAVVPQIVIQGDNTTPTNFVVTCNANCGSASNNCIFCFENVHGRYAVAGFATSTTGSATSTNHIQVQGSGLQLFYSNWNFGTVTGSASHIACQYASSIDNQQSFAISGGVTGTGSHLSASNDCVLHERTGTVTITNTPAFSPFANAHNVGIIGITGSIYSGSATGVRCNADGNSVIDSGGTSASIPGNSACTSASGGQVL